MRTPVTLSVRLPFALKRDGKLFVSWCPVLDVYSQGPSHKKSLDNLTDALRLFLLSCYERGTLDHVLRASGFRPATVVRRRSTRKSVGKRLATIEVQLPFLVDLRRKEPCPA